MKSNISSDELEMRLISLLENAVKAQVRIELNDDDGVNGARYHYAQEDRLKENLRAFVQELLKGRL